MLVVADFAALAARLKVMPSDDFRLLLKYLLLERNLNDQEHVLSLILDLLAPQIDVTGQVKADTQHDDLPDLAPQGCPRHNGKRLLGYEKYWKILDIRFLSNGYC